ncbi:MAG TPA: pyridoxamine 5'-phosphate oxidase family protein, partial [Gemmatimonadaceae bacterium]
MPDNTAVLNSPPSADDAPLLSALGRKACEAILARNSVGRIAFSLHDSVRIVPIHYAYASGWIYGRTAAAGKLEEILRNRRVAFEVDE